MTEKVTQPLINTTSNLIGEILRPLIDAFIKPRVEKFIKDHKINKEFLSGTGNVIDKFSEYFEMVYKQYSVMNTIVFKNQQVNIEELYVPLHVVNAKDSSIIYKIDNSKIDLLSKYKRILITDTAGMGKSTILKWMFISEIRKGESIPFIIELRRLKSNILEEVCKKLLPFEIDKKKEFIISLLQRGDFIFYFDGYDEIPLNEKQQVNGYLIDFINLFDNNIYLLTSRPEPSLASFGNFQEFNIKPLIIDESYELIRKYDKNGIISKALIERLSVDSTFQNVTEFLTNPLLTSLLYKAFSYKPSIPFKKYMFYDQVFDSLFESHDFTKVGYYERKKYSKLDSGDFNIIMRTLGMYSFSEGKIEYTKDEILEKIMFAKKENSNIIFKEVDFLDDLVKNVCLFRIDGIYYKWVHKSFQEYFAAKFICYDTKENQQDVLSKLYYSDKLYNYIDLLDFCYDLDYKTFRKSIIYQIIISFLNYCNSSYRDIDRTQIKMETILERQSKNFQRKFLFFKYKYKSTYSENGLENPIFLKLFYDMQNMGNKIMISTSNSWLENNEKITLHFFIYKEIKNEILDLLVKKHDYIIDNFIYQPVTHKFQEFPENHPLLLDDNPNSLFNTKDNFEKTTDSLPMVTDYGFLNYYKCIEVKTGIERDTNNNFFANELLRNL